MKRVALFCLLITAMSCSPVIYPSVKVYFADYRPYSDSGFFISPDPYSAGPFESLGELYIEVTTGTPNKADKGARNKNDDGIYSRPEKVDIEVGEINYNELLDFAVSEAKSVGADGLADFKITSPSSNILGGKYTISGLCIKRQ